MPWSFDQVCSIIAAKAAEAERVSLFVAASALSDKELLAMNYLSEDEVMKFVEFKLQGTPYIYTIHAFCRAGSLARVRV